MKKKEFNREAQRHKGKKPFFFSLCLCTSLLNFLVPAPIHADFISLEWLYLTSQQDGMAYAISPTQVYTLPTPWNSGFQAGLDLSITKQGVDTLLEYTQYLTSSSSKQEGSDFLPTFAIGAPSPVSNPEASWEMALRMLNLEIGDTIKRMKKLILRPHIGLSALWHTQTLRINYSGLGMEQDLRRWGLGIRAGLDSSWIISHGFSLFGDTAITSMWNRFRINRTEPSLSTKNNFMSLKPVYEMVFGLSWEQGTFAIRAGWNLFSLMENNQFLKLTEEANHGDLSLMGGSLKVTWGF